ncbi:MAG TPA: sialidase family protein [Candidatus Limnocylindria bacterium]
MRRTPLTLAIALVIVVAAAGTAIATSSNDSQANQPQVAGDAASNTTAVFPTNKQNEPAVAIAPDGTSAIAGSNDEQKQPACGPGPQRGLTAAANDCSFVPGVGTSGVYTSSDAGASWTNLGLLPGYNDTGAAVAPSAGPLATSVAPGTIVSDGDPVIVFGPKRGTDGAFSWSNGTRAYYANLSSYTNSARQGQQAPELIGVSISDDLGATWHDPIVAVAKNGYIFNDKEDIWADRNENSPFFGRVYITWTQFRDIPGFAEPVMVVYSADGGLTWSRPNQLSIAQNIAFGGRQGSVVRTGPDGTVYAIWEDSDRNGPKQVLQTSADGGRTWSKTITIAHNTDVAAAIPGSNFRTDSFASAGVDQTSGAVYVAWSDAAGGNGHIVVSKSTTHGRTWSTPATVSTAAEGYAFFQGLDVAPNGRVDIGYQALVAANPATIGTGNAAIDSYYVSSTDGGLTWSAPLKVSSASSDPAASAQNNLALQFWGDYNTLASTDATALFIYTDSRNGAGCPAVDAYQQDSSATKPAPENDCPAQFGNSDVFVSKITP